MTTTFERIAIVNRGEPAMRLINAVEELNHEHGTAMRTIALYTDADRTAMFVRRADESCHLGSATFVDEQDNRQVRYLDLDRLERALVESRAEAVWVGWGFVSERPEFVEMCERLGVTFIGPSSEVMRRVGDKISSKLLAEQADVPVAAWSGGSVDTIDAARDQAGRLGYPLLVKSTAGGGGRGIRRVASPDELAAAYESARAEAFNAFGNGTVFLETLVPEAKHIEVQIIGDTTGTVWSVGVRDCSVQRRHQKLFEEAPSPSLTADQDAAIRDAARRLGVAAGYTNAGTVEFLFDPDSGGFWFMEINARLQVEHPVTELTTGVDMVKLQIAVAQGHPLPSPEPPPTVGHAIEARLNAEDPDAGFAPAPGRIDLLRFPTGPGIRVDTGVEQGDMIASEFDSMIAKVLAVGRDRDEALARLRRALSNTALVVDGGTSNKAYLKGLLDHPEVRDATADIGWVDRMTSEGTSPRPANGNIAIVVAAIEAHRVQMEIERRQFRALALRGRPEVDTTIGRVVELVDRGESYRAEVLQLAPDAYQVVIGDTTITVRRHDVGNGRSRVSIRGRTYKVLASVQGASLLIEVDGHPHRIGRDDGGIIRAPSPSVVVSIDVEPGDDVEAGDRLAVIEAMKMETVIEADFAGQVTDVLVPQNAQVGAGAPLLVVRPAEDAVSSSGRRVSFDELQAPGQFAHGECRHYFEAIHQALLGFDVDPSLLARMSNPGSMPCEESTTADERRKMEDDLLETFVDIVALFRREPSHGGREDIANRRTAEELLFDYLLHTERRAADLPDSFVEQLRRSLARFGVDDLEPSLERDEALHRMVLSHHRMTQQIPTILTILQDRIANADTNAHDGLGPLTERILRESRRVYPAVHDLAEELRYQVVDEPFVTKVRDRALQAARIDIARLEAEPPAAERAAIVEALVACTQPLGTIISGRFRDASAECQATLLEVLIRRYYRIRELENIGVSQVGDIVAATAEYDRDGRRIHLVAVHADVNDLASTAEQLRPLLDTADPTHDVTLDVHVRMTSAVDDADGLRNRLVATMARVLGDLELRRIVLAVTQADLTIGMAGILHFTLRPDGQHRYREEELYRNLHPMMGKRLELWRLDEFDVRRVPSAEGIYAFHGFARENRRDERLFVLAEARDLTPIVDDDGRLVRLPEAERVYHEALGALRRFQAQRPAGKRLMSNRLVVRILPPLLLNPDQIARSVERLTPDADGLGLHEIDIIARLGDDDEPIMLTFSNPSGTSPQVDAGPLPTEPIRPLHPYEQNVVRLRQRGLVYPYELIRYLTPETTAGEIPPGEFVEYDLAETADEAPRLEPVDRPPGGNSCNVVVGVISNRTDRYPDGMRRVFVAGDPSRGMGNLAEDECTRINAAIDLASDLGLPLEWFAVSSGARIAMDSGTENMDWIARVLRRLIEFTQADGIVNIVVTGINVGAQPYWNAEATMLMHTKGVLIMIPESAMVLTGKEALDFSGGVSADDNVGIGGYERIMGPNGQAQYFAHDLGDACAALLRHYEYTYREPGEQFGRPAPTDDPIERDIGDEHHGGLFPTIRDVFDEACNPGRKQPFEMRRLMSAVVDRDRPAMERWFGQQGAEIAVTWDAFLGGRPVALIGFEAKNLPRLGFVPADGPDHWTSGTLFPEGSRKIARAINAASGIRPLVVLANLSGFDGSPESMRTRQLEFGAEIGRAVVNFDGPIVFCVVSRFHGGAFVVFSRTLNDNYEVAALEGSKASVIGGAPAAAVVFARDVRARVEADPAVTELQAQISAASGAERSALRAELARVREALHADKMGELAVEFDGRHDIRRAKRVGSVDEIIAPSELRPYLIGAIERGVARASDG